MTKNPPGFNLITGQTSLGFQTLPDNKILLSINSTETIIPLADFKLFLSEIQFRLK